MELIGVKIPSQYLSIGLQLGLTESQLEAIHPRHQSLDEYNRTFYEIFKKWKKCGSPAYTWGTIIKVLQSDAVNQASLADEVAKYLYTKLDKATPG